MNTFLTWTKSTGAWSVEKGGLVQLANELWISFAPITVGIQFYGSFPLDFLLIYVINNNPCLIAPQEKLLLEPDVFCGSIV